MLKTLLAALRTSTREPILWPTEPWSLGDREIYNGQMQLIEQGEGIITTIIIWNPDVRHSKEKGVSLEESEKEILTKI